MHKLNIFQLVEYERLAIVIGGLGDSTLLFLLTNFSGVIAITTVLLIVMDKLAEFIIDRCASKQLSWEIFTYNTILQCCISFYFVEENWKSGDANVILSYAKGSLPCIGLAFHLVIYCIHKWLTKSFIESYYVQIFGIGILFSLALSFGMLVVIIGVGAILMPVIMIYLGTSGNLPRHRFFGMSACTTSILLVLFTSTLPQSMYWGLLVMTGVILAIMAMNIGTLTATAEEEDKNEIKKDTTSLEEKLVNVV